MLKPGSEEVRQLFQQKDGVVMLNHGAGGLSPQPVLEKRIKFLREQEKSPEVWFRVTSEKRYSRAVEAAAEFIDCDFEDSFVVDNATTGINTILKSIKFEKGDNILLTSHSYQAVKNTVDELQETKGIFPQSINIPLPIIDDSEIVTLYEEALSKHPNVKVAIIDHITSPSSLVLPIDILCDICKKRDVLTIIDRAHAPGQLKLSLRNSKADFYVATFNKWVYASRSTGMLWVAPRHRGTVIPLVTSVHSEQSMHRRFSYTGMRDISNYFTLPRAIQFYQSVGGLETLQRHAEELLTWSQEMLCEALGTKPFPVPKSMQAPFTRVIGLPSLPEKYRNNSADEMIVHFCLNYSVQVVFFHLSGQL